MKDNSISIGSNQNSPITVGNEVQGNFSVSVTASIKKLPDSSEPNKPGIKESLTQLQAAIEAESNLSQEDKEEALKKLQSLAEAGKNPQENQQKAKGVIRFFKGLFTELPKTAKLIQEWKKLLPAIASFFGFEN
ncbi:MAG: hypothetical protein F6K23_08820 [Okeania sp. SIO2C9]|uniref:hypothetical protein n=1 Tax=Okeania sp. SIO2C9 TaxID=2607791 RepID=UPI0013C145DE|nr:hypothetical protein [Okeania sp. SIO2C9]NEQ73167.1 hypothetical protein [Okeania sp. SIO2C9]